MFFVYFLILVFTISICLMFYTAIVRTSQTNQAASRLEAVLMEIEWELNTAIEKASEYSQIIGFSTEVQDYLGSPTGSRDEISKAKIESPTISIIMGSSLIDSIYIYDFNGNYYAATDNFWRADVEKDIDTAPWYQEVVEADGNYIVQQNGGSFLNKTDEDYLSVIRLVNDTRSLEPIGVLIVNVPLQEITTTSDKQDAREALWQLTSDDGSLMYSSGQEDISLVKHIDPADEAVQAFSAGKVKFDGRSARYEPARLTIFAALEQDAFSGEYQVYFYGIVLLSILDLLTILVLTLLLTRSIEQPLKTVLDAMADLKQKNFKKVEIPQTNREMTMLQNGYNAMAEEIHELFEGVQKEQRQKRMYELRVLNAQVRPHFLYNTFDSVCALALRDRSRDVYLLMQALGKYYRISLHKGDENITVREELNIIKNYVVIQKYRFEDVFDVKYNVDVSLLDYHILKLTLQPFVENAIYHGLKTKGRQGTIVISGRKEEQFITLVVADNGVGMSQDKIQRVLSGQVDDEERSFGVYGTVERIMLHYGEDASVTITSQEDQGTTVTIRVPLL